MIDIGYVALDNAQSPALAATNPYSLAKVPEIADHPYGAPRHTCVTKAGTNIDHRLAFPLLSTAASGAKRPPLPERVSVLSTKDHKGWSIRMDFPNHATMENMENQLKMHWRKTSKDFIRMLETLLS